MATVEFIGALVVRGDRLYVASSPDSHEPYTPFTRMFSYFGDRPERPWTRHDLPWWTVELAMSRHEDGSRMRCVLSQEGDIGMTSPTGLVTEKIAGAGVVSPGAKGYGYLSGLRHIGEHLYVCGSGGQVYKRLGPDNWIHADDGLLQDPEALLAGKIGRLLLTAIGGATENDIYVAGSLPGEAGYEGVLFHSDGTLWRPVAIPRARQLNAICIENPNRVWLCGQDGALLVGNAREGFEDWSDTAQGRLFHDVTMYDDTLYLASNKGLYAYHGRRRRVVRVKTGLKPEPKYISTVDHADGVLWCVGPKDIVRFDGTGWSRLRHPDNPKPGNTKPGNTKIGA